MNRKILIISLLMLLAQTLNAKAGFYNFEPNIYKKNLESKNKEKLYKRSGAAQLRIAAAEVNISEAVDICDTKDPNPEVLAQCCDNTCYPNYSYCPIANDCCANNCGAYDCASRADVCPSIELRYHTIDSIITADFADVSSEIYSYSGKRSFNGIYIQDETKEISQSNPLIVFRRQVNFNTKPEYWQAMEFYPDPKNPNIIVTESGELSDFLTPYNLFRAISQDDKTKNLDWKSKALFTSYHSNNPDIDPLLAKQMIETNNAIQYETHSDNLHEVSFMNIEPGPGKVFGVTKKDIYVSGVYIPAGSEIVAHGNKQFRSGKINDPSKHDDFNRFRFFHPEHKTFLGDFKNLNDSYELDASGRKQAIYFNDLPDFDDNNPYISIKYNETRNQNIYFSLDGESISQEAGQQMSQETFNTLAMFQNVKRMIAGDQDFLGKQVKDSHSLFADWFGLEREGVDIDVKDHAVANKIRLLLGLPITHHDNEQKRIEDTMLIAAIDFAQTADTNFKHIIKQSEELVNNQAYISKRVKLLDAFTSFFQYVKGTI